MAAKRKAKKTGTRKPASRKKAPVRVPPKARKCERIEERKSNFHKGSFRYLQSGKGTVMVGCPVAVDYKRGARAGKTVKTVWRTDAPLGQQCVQKGTGRPVGLRAHAVLVARAPGKSCPAGYKKPKAG